MAKRYGMVIDLGLCVGCHACSVACKMEHETPEGCFNTWVEEWDQGEYPNVKRAKLPKMCNHCKDAPCVTVCPTGATYALDTGVVVVDDDICIGCGTCVTACPYDARYINSETSKVGKCNMCVKRAEDGLLPACVATCISHARIFGDLDDPNSEVSKLFADSKVVGLKRDLGLDMAVRYTDLDSIDENVAAESLVTSGGKVLK